MPRHKLKVRNPSGVPCFVVLVWQTSQVLQQNLNACYFLDLACSCPLSFSGTSSHPPSLRGSFLLFVPFKTRIIHFSSPGSLFSSSQVDPVFLLPVCRKHFCLSHHLPNWVVIFLFNGPPPPLHSGPLETGAKSYFSWFLYCLTAMPSTH